MIATTKSWIYIKVGSGLVSVSIHSVVTHKIDEDVLAVLGIDGGPARLIEGAGVPAA